MSARMGLDENDIEVDFIDGRFAIAEIPANILAAASEAFSLLDWASPQILSVEFQ
jgi:hypothetical protein